MADVVGRRVRANRSLDPAPRLPQQGNLFEVPSLGAPVEAAGISAPALGGDAAVERRSAADPDASPSDSSSGTQAQPAISSAKLTDGILSYTPPPTMPESAANPNPCSLATKRDRSPRRSWFVSRRTRKPGRV